MINYQTFSVVDEPGRADRELAQLNALICQDRLCKAVTKAAGCVLLPVTECCCVSFFYCTLVTMRMVDCDAGRKRDAVTKQHYNKWTAAPFDPALPRLAPRSRVELIWNVFDPCVCLYCYWSKEPLGGYLSPPKQEMLLTLLTSEKLHKQIINDALLGPGVDGEENLAQIILDYAPIVPPRKIVVEDASFRDRNRGVC